MDRAVEQKPDEHRRADRFEPDTYGLGGVLDQVPTLLEELGEGFAASLTRLREITSISPFPEGFFDRFLPAGARKKRILNRLSSDTEALVVQNVENIRWAALQNLDRSIRRFASALENRLEETVELTRGAVELAHRRRKQHEETVQAELQRLELGGTKLANLEELLVQFATQEGTNG
jgi:hypothetical protein